MRRTVIAIGCVLGFCLLGAAQEPPSLPVEPQRDGQWWISGGLGEGQLRLSSDQQKYDRMSTFAIGFAGGRRIGNWTRVGMEAGGWTLQAFDLNNPAVGESVGNVLAVVDYLPMRDRGVYVRGGFGWATYQNNRPDGTNGSGMAWEFGGGYEFRVSRALRLAPTVTYAAGHLGNGPYATIPLTARRYNVYDFKLALVNHFGR